MTIREPITPAINDASARIQHHAAELQKALAEMSEDRTPWRAIVTPDGVSLRQD